MIGALPVSLEIGETEYPIRSDYRNVLQVFGALNDPELLPEEKWIVAIYLLFENFHCAEDVMTAAERGFPLEEAARAIIWFILAGKNGRDSDELPSYDWEQDEQMIFSAVNNVAKQETREAEYMHWWTFLGYFNEIREGIFSYVVEIREKLNHRKSLEKHEKEFLNKNRDLVILRKKLSREEQDAEDEFQALIDEVIG